MNTPNQPQPDRPPIGALIRMSYHGVMQSDVLEVTGHTARGFTYRGAKPISIPRLGIQGTGTGEIFVDVEGVPGAWELQPQPDAGAGLTKKITDAFLRWPLPASVCSDPCASERGCAHRIGTNLLTAVEAEQMVREVVLPFLPPILLKRSTLTEEQKTANVCRILGNSIINDDKAQKMTNEQLRVAVINKVWADMDISGEPSALVMELLERLNKQPAHSQDRLALVAQALADNHGESEEGTSSGYLSDARAVLGALATPAPHAAQAEVLREKYYLLENADSVTPQILHAFATPQERDVATIGLIFGEEISTQDEAEQWDKYRQELIDTGLTPTGHDGGMGDTTDGAKEANEFGQWSKEAQLVRQEKLTSALWGFAHDIQHYPHNAKSADGTSVNLEAVACAQEIILGIFHQKKISIQ
jgi:hypothetical protein